MEKILKYYPFWIGLIICLILSRLPIEYNFECITISFILGYFKLTKFHNNN